MKSVCKVVFLWTFVMVPLARGAFKEYQTKTKTLDVKMPGARPAYSDHYLCTSVPVNKGYVVGYKALAEAKTAHHILLYACSAPYKYNGVWECGSICRGQQRGIMFAWAKNAPPLHLPEDVGYQLGEDVGVQYVVMQIHYAHAIAADEEADFSGIQLEISQERQKYKAGIFLMMSMQAIPAEKPVVHLDVSCKFTGPATIYPFGYRTHAHALSRVITGYQYNGSWHEVGKGNPQWPQAFYPTKDKVVIKNGDALVARCTYNSTGVHHTVYMGSTASDEMCNFYIMYYTDANSGETSGMCTRNGMPSLVGQIPADSDKPLPPNPLMDDIASGHHHHHGMKGGHGGDEEPPRGGGREGGTLVSPAPPVVKKPAPPVKTQPAEISGMDYYSDPYDEDYSSFDYPQRYEPRYAGKFYDDTETGRGRNRNRYPYFHQSEKEILANQYAGQDLPVTRKKDMPAESSSMGGGLARNKWGSISAKKGPGPRARHRTTPRPVNAAQQGTKAPPRKPNAARPSLPATRPPRPAPKPAKAGVKWVHVPTTMIPAPSWPADNITIGQVGGVATDNVGNLYVFHRAHRIWSGDSFDVRNVFQHQDDPIQSNTLVQMTRDGRVLKQWGAGQFYMPHGITVDNDGNIWLTDVAMHQVFRYPPDSEVPNLVLGEKFVPGKDDSHFCKPADVAIMSTGEFFVADGYCNSRIVKYSKEGKVITSWGSTSLGEPAQADGYPPTNTFNIVHSVTVAEDKGLVCASDRENGRIQCYKLEGSFVRQITSPRFGGQLYGVEYCPNHGGMLFAVNGQSRYHRPLANGEKVKCQGFSIDLDSGEITGTWQPDNADKAFTFPHAVTVDANNQEVYVGEIGPNVVWKFINAPSMEKKDSADPEFVKKAGIPGLSTHLPSPGTFTSGKKTEAGDDAASSQASIIIGALLIVPIVLMIVITVLARLHSKGKLQCCSMRRGKKPVFNYFTSHKGFDPLSTEESDHEIDPLNDSDGEDYSTTPKA